MLLTFGTFANVAVAFRSLWLFAIRRYASNEGTAVCSLVPVLYDLKNLECG